MSLHTRACVLINGQRRVGSGKAQGAVAERQESAGARRGHVRAAEDGKGAAAEEREQTKERDRLLSVCPFVRLTD